MGGLDESFGLWLYGAVGAGALKETNWGGFKELDYENRVTDSTAGFS